MGDKPSGGSRGYRPEPNPQTVNKGYQPLPGTGKVQGGFQAPAGGAPPLPTTGSGVKPPPAPASDGKK